MGRGEGVERVWSPGGIWLGSCCDPVGAAGSPGASAAAEEGRAPCRNPPSPANIKIFIVRGKCDFQRGPDTALEPEPDAGQTCTCVL